MPVSAAAVPIVAAAARVVIPAVARQAVAAGAAVGGRNLAGAAARAAAPKVEALGAQFAGRQLGLGVADAAMVGRFAGSSMIRGADAYTMNRMAKRQAERRGPMP